MLAIVTSLRYLRFAVVALLVAGFASGAPAAKLILLEKKGCYWCKKWDEQVGTIYHRTEEGRRAPLRRIMLLTVCPPISPFSPEVVSRRPLFSFTKT